MDVQNSSLDQEMGGDQPSSELPHLDEKDNSQETSDHVSPLVSEMICLQVFWLTIAALPFAAGSRNKTHPGDRAISTYSKGASRPRARRCQVCLSRSSLAGLCWRLWEPCVFKHMDGQKLQQGNLVLKEAGTHLRTNRDGLQLRHDK